MENFDLADHLRSEVIDIREPTCSLPKKILIDTNILYFCYYDRFSQLEILGESVRCYQIEAYPIFLKKLFSSEVQLFVHKIALLEFINLVKKVELKLLYYQIYNTPEIPLDFNFKKFSREYYEKYFSIQRRLVIYLNSIRKKFKLVSLSGEISQILEDIFLKWQNSLADIGEATMFVEAERDGINSVLSDDSDIVTLSNVRLYTANEKAIEAFKRKRNQC